MAVTSSDRTVKPAALAVTVADLKSHQKVSSSAEDTLVQKYIEGATWHIEKLTNRAFINQTWQITLDGFSDKMELSPSPLSSVTSITYYDGNGDQQTLASSVYLVHSAATPGYVKLAPNQSWPTTQSRDDAVTITYVAGYGAADTAVPDDIRQAIWFLASHWFVNREPIIVGSISGKIPHTLDNLLVSIKVPTLY